MGHRLSKIYTRTGDKGTTGLADGSRIKKSSLRVRCMGGLDELNASIGIILSQKIEPATSQLLTIIQHHLFDIGGDLSLPGNNRAPQKYIEHLEIALDEMNSDLAPLKEFILPGGSTASAYCHLSRTICRRVECEITTLAEVEDVNPNIVAYVNRLSDLLFVIARVLNRSEKIDDVLWQPGKS